MIDWTKELQRPDLTLKRFCWLFGLGVALQLLDWRLWAACIPVGVLLGIWFG